MENYLVQSVSHYCNISVGRCSLIRQRKIEYYDLTFVLSGSMVYVADGISYTLRKNDAIFLKPGTVRSRDEGTEPVSYVSYNFQLLPGCSLQFQPYIPQCISADIRTLISAFPQSHLSEFYHSREKAANILNYILFEIGDGLNLNSNNSHIHRITRYVGEHITECLTLAQISRTFGLSKEYVAHLFKKEMGIPLTEHINRQKMLTARELIQSNEMPLTDIATYLGYRNYSYFSRLYKRYIGVTPVSTRNSR